MKNLKLLFLISAVFLIGIIATVAIESFDSNKAFKELNIAAVVSADEGSLQCYSDKCSTQNGSQGAFLLCCESPCYYCYCNGTTSTCDPAPEPN